MLSTQIDTCSPFNKVKKISLLIEVVIWVSMDRNSHVSYCWPLIEQEGATCLAYSRIDSLSNIYSLGKCEFFFLELCAPAR